MEEFDTSSINSRSSSSILTEPITEFSTFIEKLNPILIEMKESINVTELPTVQKAIDSLETDYARAKAVMESQRIQSSPAKHIEHLAQNLGRSLGLVLFASHDLPLSNKQTIEALCKEMMNVRFYFSSDQESEYANDQESEYANDETGDETGEEETEEETGEDEIVEEEKRILTVDDAILNIKNVDEEKFNKALLLLSGFIMDETISDEKIIDENVVKVLSDRLSSCKGNERVVIIRILRHLTLKNDQHKEKMKDLEFLSALVTSLARDVEEQREAVGLLLNLSNDFEVRKRLGRIKGCIMMLVSILNNNNQEEEALHNARMLLNYMSGNTQHALHMAEAGYFKPMIKYLIEGSEMSKVLMATAISRMELTDQHKASLGEDGAIAPLVEMFKTGNLEAKLSSLNAIESLSNSYENIQPLIDSGIVVSLMQLLFSVTSVLMTLREPASAILAKMAKSKGILVKHDIVQQMLSLLNLTSPVIQNHLLEALNSIVSHSSSSNVRKKMKENGAIQLVIPFFTEKDVRIRTGALRLVHMLSEDRQGELIGELDYSHIRVIANIVLTSKSDCEKAAAIGILSNLPISDRKITEILKNENLLPYLVSIMNSSPQNLTPTLAEGISGVLLRFTVSTDKRLQRYSAENGVIPILIKMLTSTPEASRSNAALSLAQLSQNTLHLSKSRKSKWFCGAPLVDSYCEVHEGYCSANSTFCLVKSGAVEPLVRILEGEERGADEAVLSCLSTLLHDEIWESGSNFLARKSGVCSIIRVLGLGSFKAKERCIWMLERIFRVEALREEYGESAQVVLIDLAQNVDPMLASCVAKLLAQLDLLQSQSSYF